MDKNTTIHSKSVLAVEGKDECNFFKALLKYLKIENIQIIDIGGKDKFRVEFLAFSRLEGFDKVEQIGFVRDAEENQADSAFRSICGTLQECRLPEPQKPNTITMEIVPRTGIFIMPDNSGSGMLEDLCLETINSHPVKNCIDTFVTCFSEHLEDCEIAIFNTPKARVQAYLATRSPITNSLGLGALKGYWNFDAPCFYGIKMFLSTLFQ